MYTSVREEGKVESERKGKIEYVRLEKSKESSHEGESILSSIMLLLGAFAFAFCLGEAVHELGHYLSHRLNGVTVGIVLDPFGGSHILNGASAPPETWGITTLMGPLFNVLCGVTVTLLLWKRRSAMLLPLILWGPVALVQEGVTFSLGMLTPGGDADLLMRFWGVPQALLLAVGILFLVIGITLIGWLLPLVNVRSDDSFGRKLAIVLGGMVSFMVIRLAATSLRSPEGVLENTIPLVFALLLAVLVSLISGVLNPLLNRISEVDAAPVKRKAIMNALVLGAGIIVLQLLILN